MKSLDEVKSEVLRELEEGKIEIPSPYYGDRCTPTDVCIEVSGPEQYFKFTNPDDAHEAVNLAKDRVASFVGYINSEDLYAPELHFRFPQSADEAYLPASRTFEADHKINVNILKEFGDSYLVKGTCKTRGVLRNFSLTKYSPVGGGHIREYKPVKQDGKVIMAVVRSPILWTIGDGSGPEIKRPTGLVGSVAENMLEPWTSNRIAYLIGDEVPEDKMSQLCWRISKRATLEESVLAEALTKLWLLDTQNEIPDEVFSARLKESKSISPEFIQNVAARIRKHGIQNTILLYSSKEWNLQAFLEGTSALEEFGEEEK